jgi:hypothetical protein
MPINDFAHAFLASLPVNDRQILSELAVRSWLDTIAPEERKAALATWVQRVTFHMQEDSTDPLTLARTVGDRLQEMEARWRRSLDE